MIEEPNPVTLRSITSTSHPRMEVMLLLFIVLFALLGLIICLCHSSDGVENLSYLSPSIQTDFNI